MTRALSGNRDYLLLWLSRSFAEVGGNATKIAFPLVILALTDSPVATGLATAAFAVAQVVSGLPAGALVDRWNRKRVMLASEAVGVSVLITVVVALWSGAATVWHIVGAAIVLGCCAALFDPAEEASLPHVVPAEQLPTAVALNGARASLGRMAGTSLGGVLFGLGRALPFLADAILHIVAFSVLLFVRIPRGRRQPTSAKALAWDIWVGLRWVCGQHVLREFCAAVVAVNVLFQTMYLVVLIRAEQQGLPTGEIGVMAGMLGVGGLIGALLAPWLQPRLGPYLSTVSVFWSMALLAPLLAWLSSGYLLGLVFVAMTLLAPTANTSIISFQLLLTPEGMRGRVSGLFSLLIGLSASVGPAIGGSLVQWAGATAAVFVSAGVVTVVAVLFTASPVLRSFPDRTDSNTGERHEAMR